MKTGNIIFCLLASLFFCFNLTATRAQNTAMARQLLAKGEKLAEQREFDRALQHFNQALQLQDNLPEAYLARATCHEQLNNYKLAIQDYLLVKRLQPNSYEARFSLAHVYALVKRYPEAIEEYTSLLEIPFTETRAVFFRQKMHRETKLAGATGIFTLESSQAEIYHNRGRAWAALKSYENALKDYEAAIARDSLQARYFNSRGESHTALQHFNKAGADYRRALQLEPGNSIALYNLAALGRQTGNAEATRQALDQAILQDNEFASAWLNRGVARYEAGDYRGALSDYDSALARGAQEVELYMNRGMACEKLQLYLQAFADFTKALELDAGWYKPWLLRANLHFRQKQYRQAVDDYTNALAWQPENPHVLYNRGLALHYLGQNKKACQDLSAALALGMKQAAGPLQAWCE